MKALTDEQINDLNLKYGWFEFGDAQSAKTKAFVRDVEALCAEKAEAELAELREAVAWLLECSDTLKWVYTNWGLAQNDSAEEIFNSTEHAEQQLREMIGGEDE